MSIFRTGQARCGCAAPRHAVRFVAVTGGPGAGKTAVLEMATRIFCGHVGFLPEAAGIVFAGGFPRVPASLFARRAAQRAIYGVQRQLEQLVTDEGELAIALCDRGTVDGVAYWPDAPETYWRDVGTTPEAELARYHAVVHLDTPTDAQGYQRSNPLRVESAFEADEIDRRIAAAWAGHPRRYAVDSASEFPIKASHALELIRAQLPECCRDGHAHEEKP